MRVLARQNDGVDDGWLCDKGRFAYQSIHVDERVTTPMIRDGGELRAVDWDRALDEAAAILKRAGANAAALALTAVANTAANRRLAFRVRGREGLWRHHAGGAAVFVLTLALTTGALTVLHSFDAAPARWLELGVLVAATLTATVTRYVALRTWVFRAPLTARTRCAPSPRAGSTR
jgi:anaerobic selenocysteine-containing dehydrogenase